VIENAIKPNISFISIYEEKPAKPAKPGGTQRSHISRSWLLRDSSEEEQLELSPELENVEVAFTDQGMYGTKRRTEIANEYAFGNWRSVQNIFQRSQPRHTSSLDRILP
jgi:hypothetical protein